MNRLSFAPITLLALVWATAVVAEPQEKSQEGVVVTIERAEDSIKGFKAFKVTSKNTVDKPRSVNLKIYLNDRNSKEPAGARGSCTVFAGLKAGASKTEVKQCKETKPSNSWSFDIVKVYKFLLK